jgi:hypothetical protein
MAVNIRCPLRILAGTSIAVIAAVLITPSAAYAVPTAPQALRVTGAGYDTVSLAWEPSAGVVAYYQILRNGQWVDSAYGTSATLRYLVPGTAYTIAVRARDGQGNISSPIAITASTRADTQPPTAPANLRLVAGVPGTPAGLTWDNSTDDRGVGTYWLFANGDPIFAGAPGVPLWFLTDVYCTVFSGETYTFTVRAQDLSGRLSTTAESVTVTIP